MSSFAFIALVSSLCVAVSNAGYLPKHEYPPKEEYHPKEYPNHDYPPKEYPKHEYPPKEYPEHYPPKEVYGKPDNDYDSYGPTKTIAEIVAKDPRFSTLLEALKIADLLHDLSGHGTFTLFAPTNDAFDKIPKKTLHALFAHPGELKEVLLRHSLDTKILSFDIPEGSTKVKTIGGEKITITNEHGHITIHSSAGEARVILTDILAKNGVVHAVDTVF